MPNNKCKCGGIEIAEHLLLNYKEYRQERKTLFSKVREGFKAKTITLLILLYTTVRIRETLVFLKETSISTRKWH